jgi:quercetin dioxygenase-like cupin family protein
VTAGEFEVEASGATQRAKAGETLRYRCDRPHTVRCIGPEPGQALMVCVLKAAVME